MASLPAPWRSRRAGLAAGLGDAEEQVLGRDVLVAEALGLVLGTLEDAPGARVERERAALDAGALGEDGGELAAERRAGRRRAGGGSRPGCRRRARRARAAGARRRARALRVAWPCAWAARTASWAFWVNRSSCMVGSPRVRSARVGLVDEVDERGRRRSCASSDRSVGRTTRTLTKRSPGPSALKRGMPRPVRRKVRPFWVPAGIVSRTRPLSVSTGTSAPSRASSRVSGSSRSRSAPRAGEDRVAA